jgi:hypothetical protein
VKIAPEARRIAEISTEKIVVVRTTVWSLGHNGKIQQMRPDKIGDDRLLADQQVARYQGDAVVGLFHTVRNPR